MGKRHRVRQRIAKLREQIRYMNEYPKASATVYSIRLKQRLEAEIVALQDYEGALKQ